MVHIPGLDKRRRIVDPDLHSQRLIVCFLPDFDSFHLVGEVGIVPSLVDSRSEPIGMNDQPWAVPETDRIAIGSGQQVFLGRVVPAVGMDAPDVIAPFR